MHFTQVFTHFFSSNISQPSVLSDVRLFVRLNVILISVLLHSYTNFGFSSVSVTKRS